MLKEFVSISKKETRKRNFQTFHGCLGGKKCFTNNKIPVDSNYHWKNWVDLISRPTKQEKKLQLQKTYILRKRAQKLKNIYT